MSNSNFQTHGVFKPPPDYWPATRHPKRRDRALHVAIWIACFESMNGCALADDAVANTDRSSTITQEVVVFGRAEKLIGKAIAASEGTVSGADLAVRPSLRVAELLEVVPGLI